MRELSLKNDYRYQVRRIERHPLIDVRVHTQVRAVHGHAGTLIAVTIAGADGRPERRAARALFLCIGGHPHTDWTAAAGVQTDSVGYIFRPDLLVAAERPADWPPPPDDRPHYIALANTIIGVVMIALRRSASSRESPACRPPSARCSRCRCSASARRLDARAQDMTRTPPPAGLTRWPRCPPIRSHINAWPRAV